MKRSMHWWMTVGREQNNVIVQHGNARRLVVRYAQGGDWSTGKVGLVTQGEERASEMGSGRRCRLHGAPKITMTQ